MVASESAVDSSSLGGCNLNGSLSLSLSLAVTGSSLRPPCWRWQSQARYSCRYWQWQQRDALRWILLIWAMVFAASGMTTAAAVSASTSTSICQPGVGGLGHSDVALHKDSELRLPFSVKDLSKSSRQSVGLSRCRGGHSSGSDRDRGDLSDDLAGSRGTDLILGQDRDLFHISLDLKWLYLTITNGKFWFGLADGAVSTFLRFFGLVDHDKHYQDIALTILATIRKSQPQSSIKFFRGSLQEAGKFSIVAGKSVILYVEERPCMEPSSACLAYRAALADAELGAYINENFIFLGTTIEHTPTKKLLQKLGLKVGLNPVLVVLCPKVPSAKIVGDTGKAATNMPVPKKVDLEVAANLRLSSNDVNPTRLQRFLQKASEMQNALHQRGK